MKRRRFTATVNGELAGHAFAYNSALRVGESFIRRVLPPGGSVTYLRGHIDRDTRTGWKEWASPDGTVFRVDVAPEMSEQDRAYAGLDPKFSAALAAFSQSDPH